jgi:hypothetical protein
MDTDEFDIPDGWEEVELVESDADVEDTGDEDEDDLESPAPLDGTAPSVGDDDPKADPVLSRELAEARAKLRALEAEKQNGMTEAQWGERFRSIQSQYVSAKKNIFRLANNDEDPGAFIEREMDRLVEWRDGELGKYHGSREADLKNVIAQLKVPEYADQLLKDLGLPKSYKARLMEVSPQEMETRAKGLLELYNLEKQIQGNRTKAKKVGQRAVSTGSTGARNVRKVKVGTDDHLFALDPTLRPANYSA